MNESWIRPKAKCYFHNLGPDLDGRKAVILDVYDQYKTGQLRCMLIRKKKKYNKIFFVDLDQVLPRGYKAIRNSLQPKKNVTIAISCQATPSPEGGVRQYIDLEDIESNLKGSFLELCSLLSHAMRVNSDVKELFEFASNLTPEKIYDHGRKD